MLMCILLYSCQGWCEEPIYINYACHDLITKQTEHRTFPNKKHLNPYTHWDDQIQYTYILISPQSTCYFCRRTNLFYWSKVPSGKVRGLWYLCAYATKTSNLWNWTHLNFRCITFQKKNVTQEDKPCDAL